MFNSDQPVKPECCNTDCEINGELNVYTVDEDIYSFRPKTVDVFINSVYIKFAIYFAVCIAALWFYWLIGIEHPL